MPVCVLWGLMMEPTAVVRYTSSLLPFLILHSYLLFLLFFPALLSLPTPHSLSFHPSLFTSFLSLSHTEADQSCKQWIDKENENEKTWYADLPPCPCVIQQAQQDWRYRFFSWGVSESCAVAGDFLATTECCYNVSTGALLVDPPSAGGYRRYSPIFSRSLYTEDTVKPHQYCCESGSNMCDAYYNLRPIDDCSGYQPVRIGKLTLK